jgi:hypothetical protein
LHVWPPLASRFHSSVVSIDTLSCEYGFTESYRRRSVYLCEIAILKAAPGTILATGGGATGTPLRCVYQLPTTSTRLQTLLSFRVQGERRPMASKSFVHFRSHLKGLYGGFRTLVSRSYYYLRRRSPGPPFPPDHRQAGERGAINAHTGRAGYLCG